MKVLGYIAGSAVYEQRTAHDPHSGQFTSGGGGQKLGPGSKADAIGFLHTVGKLRHAWGPHEQEIEAALLSPGKKRVLRDHKGAIQAAIATEHEPGHIHVDHLGSLVKGGGTRLMKTVIAEAKKHNARLTLVPSATSEGFYKKLGFRPTGHGNLWEHR